MRVKRVLMPCLAIVLSAFVFGLSPRAEEGFWPYNSIPKAAIKAKYGFDVTDAWLYCRRRMTHGFGKDKPPPLTPVERQQLDHARQLRAMQAHRAKREDPWGTFRGGSRPW